MRVIQLTQGQHTVVDDDVFEWASKFKWFAYRGRRTFYAGRQIRLWRGRQTTVSLSREIMKAPYDLWVDHRDGDGLNNLCENLRLCPPKRNAMNYPRPITNTSGYKGVSFFKQNGKWKAEINASGKHIYLGLFDTALEAARAYDISAAERHGEFARLNFPQEVTCGF